MTPASQMGARRASAKPSTDNNQLSSARAYATLRAQITALQLLPGRPLSEKDIAEGLGISRTPVREAFIRLSEEGLIDIYPQFGTFVAPIRLPAVLHAAFIRDSLECAIVRVLALRRRSAFLDELRLRLSRQWAAVRAEDAAVFFEEDERMHQSFSEEAGHEPVWRVIDAAKVHVDRARRLKLPEDFRIRGLVEEHERIADALAAQDADAAVEAMHEHLQGVLRGLDSLARRHPDYFEKVGSGRPSRTNSAADRL